MRKLLSILILILILVSCKEHYDGYEGRIESYVISSKNRVVGYRGSVSREIYFHSPTATDHCTLNDDETFNSIKVGDTIKVLTKIYTREK